MPPCSGTFGSFQAPKPIKVQATTNDGDAVYSLTVLVQPRGGGPALPPMHFSRTDLENGTAAWELEPSRVYTLLLLAGEALTLQTTIEVGTSRIVDGSCGSAAEGIAGVWMIPTRRPV